MEDEGKGIDQVTEISSIEVPDTIDIGELVEKRVARESTRAVRQYAKKVRERARNKRRKTSRNKNRRR